MTSLDPQAQRRSDEDARRSLARFMSVLFPDSSIYISPREPEGQRPSVVVRMLGGRSVLEASHHTITESQPFAVYVYPEILEDERAAETAAHALRFEVTQAIEFGIAELSYHHRLPMWNWEGVDEYEEIPPDDDVVIDFYRVEGFEATALPDPDDARRWSIACTLRLVWSRHAGVASTATVQDLGFTLDTTNIH